MQYPRLGDDVVLVDEDVSVVGPALLMLGVLGAGGVLYWLNQKSKDDYYYEDEESDAIEQVKAVVGAIEKDEPED